MKVAIFAGILLVCFSLKSSAQVKNGVKYTPEFKSHLANGWKKLALDGLWKELISLHARNLQKPNSIYLLYEAEHETIWFISIEIHQKAVIGYLVKPDSEGLNFHMLDEANSNSKNFEAVLNQLKNIIQIQHVKTNQADCESPYLLRVFISTETESKQLDVYGSMQIDERSPLGLILTSK